MALAGDPGSKKSTIISLVEHFYNHASVFISVDGRDIRTLYINEYHAFFVLILQDPMLYQSSARKDVLLSVNNDAATVSEAWLTLACEEVNIYDLIMSLLEGFGMVVGSKSSLISSSQNHRIVIARARFWTRWQVHLNWN